MQKVQNKVPAVQLLSVRDVAEVLAISVRSVWRLRAAGLLPEPVRVGGAVRWRRSQIDRWLDLDCPNRVAFDAATRRGDE